MVLQPPLLFILPHSPQKLKSLQKCLWQICRSTMEPIRYLWMFLGWMTMAILTKYLKIRATMFKEGNDTFRSWFMVYELKYQKNNGENWSVISLWQMHNCRQYQRMIIQCHHCPTLHNFLIKKEPNTSLSVEPFTSFFLYQASVHYHTSRTYKQNVLC